MVKDKDKRLKKSPKYLKWDRYGIRCKPKVFLRNDSMPFPVSINASFRQEDGIEGHYFDNVDILITDRMSSLTLTIDFENFTAIFEYMRIVRSYIDPYKIFQDNDKVKIEKNFMLFFTISYNGIKKEQITKSKIFVPQDVIWEITQHVYDALEKAKDDSRITPILTISEFCDCKVGDICKCTNEKGVETIVTQNIMFTGIDSLKCNVGQLAGISRFQ